MDTKKFENKQREKKTWISCKIATDQLFFGNVLSIDRIVVAVFVAVADELAKFLLFRLFTFSLPALVLLPSPTPDGEAILVWRREQCRLHTIH